MSSQNYSKEEHSLYSIREHSERDEKKSVNCLLVDTTSSPTAVSSSNGPKEEEENSEKEVKSTESWSLREAMDNEDTVMVFKQSAIPFLLAGLCSIGAGQSLNQATRTTLFRTVPEMTALSTPLMGLKGNLDMTFASRLTTMAHKGQLKTQRDAWENVPIYIYMVQSQAIVMALLASIITLLMMKFKFFIGIIPPMELEMVNSTVVSRWHFLPLLSSTSLLTITVSAGCMSYVTVKLVLMARRYHINPDNIIAPIAASVGDLVCMLLLVGFGHLLFYAYPLWWICVCVSVTVLCLLPIWVYLTWKDEHARYALKTGWTSLILSTLIQCVAGCVLDYTCHRFPECTLYQLLLSGIAGNRVAVLSSRISSLLHTNGSVLGSFPNQQTLWFYVHPKRIIVGKDGDVRCARLLLFTSVPYQLVFLCMSYLTAWIFSHIDHIPEPKINIIFTLGYIVTAFVQICTMLYCCQLLCYSMWYLGIDPDFHSIPLLTGLGDLSGALMMLLLYVIMETISPDSITIGGQS